MTFDPAATWCSFIAPWSICSCVSLSREKMMFDLTAPMIRFTASADFAFPTLIEPPAAAPPFIIAADASAAWPCRRCLPPPPPPPSAAACFSANCCWLPSRTRAWSGTSALNASEASVASSTRPLAVRVVWLALCWRISTWPKKSPGPKARSPFTSPDLTM